MTTTKTKHGALGNRETLEDEADSQDVGEEAGDDENDEGSAGLMD